VDKLREVRKSLKINNKTIKTKRFFEKNRNMNAQRISAIFHEAEENGGFQSALKIGTRARLYDIGYGNNRQPPAPP
jgi:hypothetical protein